MTGPGRARRSPGPDGSCAARGRCPPGRPAAITTRSGARPVRDDRGIFERLCLEAFQSGLSWLTILRKRENFRAAFGGFDLAVVARFGPADVDRLLGDRGIIRNRAKITAVIGNAKAALAVPGGVAALVWSYAEDAGRQCTGRQHGRSPWLSPTWTPASKALARELRGHGFAFTGPVTVYAAFQACGVVNDHLRDCFRRGAYRAAARREICPVHEVTRSVSQCERTV